MSARGHRKYLVEGFLQKAKGVPGPMRRRTLRDAYGGIFSCVFTRAAGDEDERGLKPPPRQKTTATASVVPAMKR